MFVEMHYGDINTALLGYGDECDNSETNQQPMFFCSDKAAAIQQMKVCPSCDT